jgi:hypothetical protein
VARKARGWIEPVARIGYGAKGVVYCLIGMIAVMVAVGLRERVADQRGVMKTLLAQPFGKVMLLAMTVGLSCYTLWYFVQAILDPEGAGHDWKGAAKRVGQLGKGMVHAGLVLAILRLMIGLRSDESTDARARDWTAWVMGFPAGIWMVAGIGVGVLGYGFFQIWRAWKISLDEQLELARFGRVGHAVVIWLSRFGLFARAVLFGTMGIFLIVAAMRADPREARGVAAAMKALEEQRYGPVILGAVAMGLFAYGVYQFLRAKYRRIG